MPLNGDSQTSFETAEEQVLHFLARAGRPRWKWMSVRPRSPVPHFSHNGATPMGTHHNHHNGNNGQGGGGSRKAEPYYCDRYLVQSLVRDSMVTDALDKPSHTPRREDKQWVKFSFWNTSYNLIDFLSIFPAACRRAGCIHEFLVFITWKSHKIWEWNGETQTKTDIWLCRQKPNCNHLSLLGACIRSTADVSRALV